MKLCEQDVSQNMLPMKLCFRDEGLNMFKNLPWMQKHVILSVFRCEVESFSFTECMLRLNAAVSLNLADLTINAFFPSWFGGQKVTGLNVLEVGIEKCRFLPIMAECHLITIIFKVLAQFSVG